MSLRPAVACGLQATALCLAVAANTGCGEDATAEPERDARDAADAAPAGAKDAGFDAGAGAADAGEDASATDAAAAVGDSGTDMDAKVDAEADADAAMAAQAPLASYCGEAAAAYYEWLQYCYGEDHYSETMRDDFVGRVEGRCLHAERAVAEGRLRYDGARASRCLASADTTDCVGQFLSDDACSGLFEGLLSPGDECYDEESRVFLVGVEACADSYCDSENACPGRCTTFQGRGEECNAARCGPQDYCEPTEQRCRARAGPGESCAVAECEQGLMCVGEEPACVVPVSSADGACDAATPCAGPAICADGQCRARVEAGQPCRVQVQCPDDTVCASSVNSLERICFTPGDEGAACSGDVHCAAPLICVAQDDEPTGTCAANPFVLGEPCDSGRCAEGLYCAYESDPADGVCQAPVGEGGSCRNGGIPDSRACLEGLYCTEQDTCAPPGAEGDPCNVFQLGSCAGELWCSRATALCTVPASQDEPCNPYWPNSCTTGLGCACGLADRDACGGTTRQPSATDSCQPRRADGEPCYREGECQSLQCQLDFAAPSATAGQCVSPRPPCLPP